MPTIDVTLTYQTEDAPDILATFTPDAMDQFGTKTPTNPQIASAIRTFLRRALVARVQGYRNEVATPAAPPVVES